MTLSIEPSVYVMIHQLGMFGCHEINRRECDNGPREHFERFYLVHSNHAMKNAIVTKSINSFLVMCFIDTSFA